MQNIELVETDVLNLKSLYELMIEDNSLRSVPDAIAEISYEQFEKAFLKDSTEINKNLHQIFLIRYSSSYVGFFSLTTHQEKKVFSFYDIFVKSEFQYLGEKIVNSFLNFCIKRNFNWSVAVPSWLNSKI